MYDLCDGLSKANIRSDFLGINADRQQTEIIEVNSRFTIYAMKGRLKIASTYISLAMVQQLKKIKSNYDIIHIHHPDPMAALSLRLSGYKGIVICHWHSDIIRQKNILKFYKPLQIWMLERSEIIIGTSPVYLKHSDFLKDYKNKLHAVPIGIPPVSYNVLPETVAFIRSKAGNRKIVFALGRLIYYKGIHILIEAAKHLNENICVFIGGKGPLESELRKQIEENNLGDKVFLLGRIDEKELSSYFSTCDVFCLPSNERSEAFGIAQIEAMAYGKPVIATNIKGSGVPWVNQDGVSGYNAEPNNPVEISEKINAVLSDTGIYKQLSKGAFQRYEDNFTQDKMVNEIIQLYKSITKSGAFTAGTSPAKQEQHELTA
jgi:rhamnosyl/mannosyltransferase